jgi:hypothetical protein
MGRTKERGAGPSLPARDETGGGPARNSSEEADLFVLVRKRRRKYLFYGFCWV